MMNSDSASRAHAAIDELASRAHVGADSAIGAGRRLFGEGRETLDAGVERARRMPETFGRAAQNVGEYARRSWDGARHRVDAASERTTDYIQHEPVRSVLVAAAAGAVIALLIGAVTYRSRERSRRW
ncbi:MAG: hypothetical protein MZW92_26370 [Comamonadaceae bacterium]|nr:hypothetical protein [Comamonadaceae bacterium]